MKYDFHCHSSVSDGSLTPSDLVIRAHKQGVQLLSITDHDDISSWSEAKTTADQLNIDLISGVEVSTTWSNKTIHILGYGFNPDNQEFKSNLVEVRKLRNQRAQFIDQILSQREIANSLQGAQKIAGREQPLSRTHFAKFLINQGLCTSFAEAMSLYLGDSKLVGVNSWISIKTAIEWIKQAGGIAFLAHPLRYKFPQGLDLIDLIGDFIEAGGEGLEVVYARISPKQLDYLTDIAYQKNLYASGGSDFHTDEMVINDIGNIEPIPSKLIALNQLIQSSSKF